MRGPSRARSDASSHASHFQTLRRAGSLQALAGSWLELQCERVPGALGGLVLARAAGDSLVPIASWPQLQGDVKRLMAAAERALSERRGVVLEREGALRAGRRRCAVAQPVERAGEVRAIAVLDVEAGEAAELAEALRSLRWGVAWLELGLGRERGELQDHRRERIGIVLDLVALLLEQTRVRASALQLTTELAQRLGCERVSLGLCQGERIELAALSHGTAFDRRADLSRALVAAMEESLEQARTVVYPAEEAASPAIVLAHAELAERHGQGAACSLPLSHAGRPCAVLTLERSRARPFGAQDRLLCEAVAALAGPILERQRRDEEPLRTKLRGALRQRLDALLGPRHALAKLVAGAAVLLASALLLTQAEYRISARGELLPSTRRALVAPFDGYVAEAPLRAGDSVDRGALLARLDDRELSLERLRLETQLEQLGNQTRQALGERDAAQLQVFSARSAELRSQLALVEAQLERARLLAPLDGVIVRGDLSQSLGSPVARGEVLFEVAPLGGYRILLRVDERDVRDVAVGQRGSMVLAAAPETPLAFTVTHLTPISRTEDGSNFFEVEASLERTPASLRPGMEGIGKISVDERPLLAIWTREAWTRLRLALWRFW